MQKLVLVLTALILTLSSQTARACYLDSYNQSVVDDFITFCNGMPPGWSFSQSSVPNSILVHLVCQGPNSKNDKHVGMTCPVDNQTAANIAVAPTAPTSCRIGSIVHPESRTMEENIPLPGTPFHLNYSSSRALGTNGYLIKYIQPFGNGCPAPSPLCPVNRGMEIKVAGQTFNSNHFPGGTTTGFNFEWNGKDSNGVRLMGATVLSMSAVDTNNPVRPNEVPFVVTQTIGSFYAVTAGLGGWTISTHHFYDQVLNTVFLGDGSSYVISKPTLVTGGGFMIASQDGGEVFVFDAQGRHLQTKNGIKGTTKYSFTYTGGKLTKITDGFLRETVISYNLAGLPLSIVGPYGHVNTLTTDGNGLLASVSNPLSETYNMSYTAEGLISTFQKPSGVTSSFLFGPYGVLVSDSSSAGSAVTIGISANGLHEVTTAEGISTEYWLDPASTNRITQGPGALRSEETYVKNSDGTISGINGRKLNGLTFADVYAQDPRIPSSTYLNRINISAGSKYHSTSIWRSATLSDPNDMFSVVNLEDTYIGNPFKVSSIAYSSSTSKFTQTSWEGRKQYVTIDSHERPVALQQATYTPVTISYDSHGRMQNIAQSGTRTSTLAYDANGKLASITNALNQTQSFGYDLAGRLTSETLPDARVISYSYDANGNLASVTPPGGLAHTFVSNGFDLVQSYTAPAVAFLGVSKQVSAAAGLAKSAYQKALRWVAHLFSFVLPSVSKQMTSLTVGVETEYGYDNDRNLTSITRPDGATAVFNYNSSSGRLDSITTTNGSYFLSNNPSYERIDAISSPDGISQALNYDGPLLASSTYSGAGSGSVYFTYNNDFMVATVKVNTAAPVALSYDTDSLIVSAGDEVITRNTATGFATKATLSNVSETYAYSAAFGELSSIHGKFSTSTNIYHEALTRDDLARVVSKTETIGSGSADVYGYTFDPAGRLTTVTKNSAAHASYTYDSNSNRTSVTRGTTTTNATYDTQDRIVTFGTKTYTHNDAGELTQVSDSATMPASVTSYTYDVFGNMKSATLPSGTTISYLLDGQNRRVGRKVAGVMDKQFVWFDQIRPAAQLSSSGVLVSQFIYGVKSNVPDYIIKGGVNYKVMTDHLGSVVAVVDSATGTVAQAMSYDEFGRVLTDTAPGFQPFGFAGGMYDPDTKLTLFGARTYDAETGRWLSKDPILFAGGDTNLYGYVMNDPVNFVDPLGLLAFNPTLGEPGNQGSTGTTMLINSYRRNGGDAEDLAAALKGDRQAGIAVGRAAANAEHYFLAKYLNSTWKAVAVPFMIPIYTGGKALDQFIGTNIFSNPDATPASLEQMGWGFDGAYDGCHQ